MGLTNLPSLRTPARGGCGAAALAALLVVIAACGRRGSYLPFETERTRAAAGPSSVDAPAPSGSPPSARITATEDDLRIPHSLVVSPDERGAVTITFGTSPVARPVWLFWAKDWAWTESEITFTPGAGDAAPTARLRNPDLGLDGSVSYQRSGDDTLQVRYDLRAAAERSKVIGGGLEFTLTPHPAMQGAPTILPAGEGWVWATKDGDALRVTFSPPLPKIYAERGDAFRIRCMFYADRIEPGRREQAMSVSAPRGAAIQSRPWPPYARESATWPVAYDRNTGPDLSFLNAAHGPAGSHGRLVRKGARLVFADGSPARFWGTNLSAYSLFHGDDASVRALARRLSALGFNLVRLHHHDSAWVEPNIFAAGSDTRTLNRTAFAALGRRVQLLKEQGIYLWIDIEVGRKFKAGDALRAFAEIEHDDHRGFSYVNPDLEAAWRDFARQYLTTKNPSTGLSFAEDPAVVAVLLTNENDVTHHFGNKMLRNQPNPVHTAMFEALAADFAANTGLPRGPLLRTWEPGPSKLLLNELEHRVFRRSRDHLRQLGLKALVATTSTWGENPTFSLPSLTSGDLIDVHGYGEGEFLSEDPRTRPTFVHWLAAAQVAGFPLSVTEWNVPSPARDRFAAPLFVASIAALQGWDMVLQYAYQQHAAGEHPDRLDRWSGADDPALMTQMPAAALLFRRGDVAEAKQTFRLELDRTTLYEHAVSPETSAAIRTLTEQSRLVIGLPDTPELAWDQLPKPAGQLTFTDPARSFLAPTATQIVSDTGELIRNWTEGYQLVDSPRSQAASGWLRGRTIELASVTIALATNKATVAVTSLDSRPIATAERLLVTATAQAASDGELPLRSEPVAGTLRLRTACRCARRLRPGSLSEAAALPASAGVVTLDLEPKAFAHWYLLERPRAADGARCR